MTWFWLACIAAGVWIATRHHGRPDRSHQEPNPLDDVDDWER